MLDIPTLRLFFLYFPLVLQSILAGPRLVHALESDAYPYNPHVPAEIWLSLEPYFLPPNHPIKSRLDLLFHQHRVTASVQTFEKYGFGKAKSREPTNIVVGKNPWFKGYVFKVYLDSQPPLCEWENWVKRIEGAQAIRQCIENHAFQHFAVPQKWIYPLPAKPSPQKEQQAQRKHFILIVEDMKILSVQNNLHAFKTCIDQQLLWELHCILCEVGLLDSVYPDNIPFNKKGQIVFIDTEHHHHSQETIPFQKLNRFLSDDMANYWRSLPFTSD